MQEFKEEFLKCFKDDNIFLKNLIGCIDFKSIFEGCLGFGNYSPGKKSSATAKSQGGRDKEYHSVHFFLDPDGMARCKGRYDELQTHWLPLEGPGISVFSPIGYHRIKTLLAAGDRATLLMPYDSLNNWGLRELVQEHLCNDTRLTDAQRFSWKIWFQNLPTSINGVPVAQKFRWVLPDLVARVLERENSRGMILPRPEIGDSTDYQQDPKYMGEVFTHAGFTPQQLKADRRQRSRNFQNRKSASERQQAAKRLQERRLKQTLAVPASSQHKQGLDELSSFFCD